MWTLRKNKEFLVVEENYGGELIAQIPIEAEGYPDMNKVQNFKAITCLPNMIEAIINFSNSEDKELTKKYFGKIIKRLELEERN